MLFQVDLTGVAPAEVVERFWEGKDEPEELRAFAEGLVHGVHEQRRELDRWIVSSARNWRIERMAVVDRNVLRMAVCELLAEDAPPAAVVLDEAIEIAQKFGSEESGGFINGVLDDVQQRIAAGRARRV
jgi:N utilization substance protein B